MNVYLKTAAAFLFIGFSQSVSAQLSNNSQANTGNGLSELPAVQNDFKLASSVSKPGNSQDYLMSNGNWQLVTNSTYTYNNQGQLTLRLMTDPNTNQNKNKQEYTYDAQGNETENTFYMWSNNTWVMMSGTRQHRTFNSQGKLTEYYTEQFTNGTWKNKDKLTYTYDAAGNIQDEIMLTWDNTSWINMFKSVYVYTNGVITKISEYNPTQSGGWNNVSQKANITWHNQAKLQMLGFTKQFNFGGGFADYGRTTYTYLPNGGLVTTEESYNGTWTYTTRTTTTYDAQNNYIGMKREGWVNNAWVMTLGNQHDLTYSATNDLMQRIIRNYSTNTNGYVDYQKEVFSNFQQFVTGTPNDMAPLLVSIYPNPTSDFLTIQLPETKSQTITATLIDVTGKKVLSKSLNSTNQTDQINLKNIPAGIYMLHLQSEHSIKTVKVVKQ